MSSRDTWRDGQLVQRVIDAAASVEDRQGWACAREVATRFADEQRRRSAVSVIARDLARLERAGLLERTKASGVFFYRTTDAGREAAAMPEPKGVDLQAAIQSLIAPTNDIEREGR